MNSVDAGDSEMKEDDKNTIDQDDDKDVHEDDEIDEDDFVRKVGLMFC